MIIRRFLPWPEKALMISSVVGVGIVNALMIILSPHIVIAAIIMSSVAGLCGWFLIRRYKYFTAKPDFTNKQYNFHVYANNIDEVVDIEHLYSWYYVIEFYIKNLSIYVKREFPMNAVECGIEADAIRAALSNMVIEWVQKDINWFTRLGWRVKDSRGVQNEKYIKLRWDNTIFYSSFLHLLHHVVHTVVLKLPADERHENKLWWGVLSDLRSDALLKYPRRAIHVSRREDTDSVDA